MATLSGELIGQQITINCDYLDNDFYMGQFQVDLSTEYDLTKGIDITFDGQLYKNVPAQFIGASVLVIGETIDNDPVLDIYPFCIALILDK